jgi:hypothetical protein
MYWTHYLLICNNTLQICDPEVDSASNRNKYQEYFLVGKDGRCVGLTTLPPSCADFREIWEPQLPGIIRAVPVLYRDYFTVYCAEMPSV